MKAWPFAALIAAFACGGERDSDLFADPARGGSGASGGKGSGGSTGGSAMGGSGTGGTGSAGKSTGGIGGAAGASGGGMTTGGKGGMAAGGSGGATGGTSGGMTPGGSGGRAGGGAGGGAMGGSSTAGAGGGKAGAGGRMTGTGGSAGAGGASSPTCDELEQAYAEAFEGAIACDPSVDFEQCTEHVPKSLPCGCETHVNPENEEAIAELARLSEQHEKLGCVVVCPEIACVEPETVCVANGSDNVGRCVDLETAN